MTVARLRSDGVRLDVRETGAMLDRVEFDLGDRVVSPMHRAPWIGENLDPDLVPVLAELRGDFLCAPFGESDVLADEIRPHGRTANGSWRRLSGDEASVQLELQGDVSGARVIKTISLRSGHPVVYQRHRFEGGSGSLPIGHHAMLRATSPLRLSFSPWTWAGTPPSPVETPPEGRSGLAYPQRIADLTRAARAGGGTVDLTRYPAIDDCEDLWMLAAPATQEIGWTAAVCAGERWVWFALKNRAVLPSTVIWMSNGGRAYAPFSGRHRRVVGLEEVCSWFDRGHRASTEANPLTSEGIPTAVELDPEHPLEVPYLFGMAEVPEAFEKVEDVRVSADRIALVGGDSAEVIVPCETAFLFGGTHVPDVEIQPFEIAIDGEEFDP